MIPVRITALLALAAAGPVAADGGLDGDFGDDGLTLIDGGEISSPGKNFARQLHVAHNGEIVIAGSIYGNDPVAWSSIVLARLTPTGQLDASFGNGGFAAIGSTSDRPYSLAAHAGGYLVGGESDGRFAVWRVDAGGHADATFGDGGSGAKILGEGSVNMLAPLASGNILLAGWSPGAHDDQGGFSLVRLMADGGLDRSFGNGGFLVPAHETIRDLGWIDSMAVTADEHFVFATGNGPRLGVFRLRPDGAIDETFGENGLSSLVLGSDDEWVYANDTRVLEDGKVLISGIVTADPWFLWPGRGFIARLNPDGSPDLSFGPSSDFDFGADDSSEAYEIAGVFQTDPEDISEIAAIAMGPGGTVLAVGTKTTNPDGGGWTGESVVMALDANGIPVEEFGDHGLLSVGTRLDPRIDDEWARDIVRHGDDGFVVLADGWTSNADRRMTVARIGLGDYIGVVGFANAGATAAEQAGVFEITLYRQGGSSGSVAVKVAVAPESTATAGEDFQLLDDAISWADGESGPRPIRVRLIDDGPDGEPEETVALDLAIADGSAKIGRARYVLTLVRDADAGTDATIDTDADGGSRGGGSLSCLWLGLLGLVGVLSETARRSERRRRRRADRAGFRR